MKISVNDKELFVLSEIQKKVICNDIADDIFQEDMKRRLKWVLTHKYEQCFKRLKAEWDKKLIDNSVTMVPTQPDAYAELVFAQSNDKNAQERKDSVRHIANEADEDT